MQLGRLHFLILCLLFASRGLFLGLAGRFLGNPLYGLLERDAHGRYQAGLGLMTLGLACARREPIAHAAQPVLEAAAHELGETFFLVVARGGRLVVLEKAEGDGFLRAAPRLGSSVPVHATAVGKLYLAHAPDAVELEALPRYTPGELDDEFDVVITVAPGGYAIHDPVNLAASSKVSVLPLNHAEASTEVDTYFAGAAGPRRPPLRW